MKTRKKTAPSATGTYVWDKRAGKLVQVSDRPPKAASKRRAPQAGPCGRSACGGGRCAGA